MGLIQFINRPQTNYVYPLDNSFVECHKIIIYHNNKMGNYFIFITYTL